MSERQENCLQGEQLNFAITGPFGRVIAGVNYVSASKIIYSLTRRSRTSWLLFFPVNMPFLSKNLDNDLRIKT